MDNFGNPTITAANVAATWAELKPKMTVRWSGESRKVFCVNHAATNFAAVISTIIMAATSRLSLSLIHI